jgi:hypothetical protein
MTATAPKFIGIAGRKRSGKDTAAIMLPREYRKLSFAKPIKAMLRTLLSTRGADHELIERMMEGDLKEITSPLFGGHTPRHAMQTLGTEWGRQCIHGSLWVDTALTEALATGECYVIPDVRFHNECNAIKAIGGVVIRVERPGRPIGVLEDHASEQEIDELDVDHVLVNDADTALGFEQVAAAFFREKLNIH